MITVVVIVIGGFSFSSMPDFPLIFSTVMTTVVVVAVDIVTITIAVVAVMTDAAVVTTTDATTIVGIREIHQVNFFFFGCFWKSLLMFFQLIGLHKTYSIVASLL